MVDGYDEVTWSKVEIVQSEVEVEISRSWMD